ncbi:hypothetical protein AB0H00_15505 [Nocardia sp. NPDC023852]|uniref:hypothetical protein n=1 Tax=Nocardia sp. NPDC023852 TaxID=3154697 RepID=UPI0033C683B8
MSGITVYNKPKIDHMYTELRQCHSDLATAGGDDLAAASETLKQAWTDDTDGTVNAAYTDGYEPVKKSWDNEFADTLSTIENIATALEEALIRAFGADKAVADGFGAI